MHLFIVQYWFRKVKPRFKNLVECQFWLMAGPIWFRYGPLYWHSVHVGATLGSTDTSFWLSDMDMSSTRCDMCLIYLFIIIFLGHNVFVSDISCTLPCMTLACSAVAWPSREDGGSWRNLGISLRTWRIVGVKSWPLGVWGRCEIKEFLWKAMSANANGKWKHI